VTYCTPSVCEIPVVGVEGEVDPTAAGALQRRLAIALVAGRGFAAVDLRAVSVEGEHAVGLLCDALRDVDRHDARLALAASPAVGRVLEHSPIDGVELYPTLGAAVAAAGRSPRLRPAARPAVPVARPAVPVAPTHIAAVSS
jgi:anti-anti-sigma regulatory factor